MNDGDDDVAVTLSSIGDGETNPLGEPITVPSGGFVQVKLNDLTEQSPLSVLLEADAPVVVERGLVFKGENGTSRQLAVPLS